jgi:hypothetical protein
MAVTANFYGNFFAGMFSTTAARRVDWATDTIKVMLTTSTYTPDQDAHDFVNDVTNEISGTGYTAGGQALTTKTVTYDSATNETRLDADDPSWTSATITTRRAVYYKDTGTAATSPVVCWVDFGADQSVTAGTFTISHAATGVGKVTAS